MKEEAFNKLRMGFLFVMIDFRLMGIDVLPDIIGYIYFGTGLALLASESGFLQKAKNINLPLLLLSITRIYEAPAGEGGGNGFTFLLGLAVMILGLFHVYYILMGIKDLGSIQGNVWIMEEADSRWNQFLLIQFASLLGFVMIAIPGIGLIYFLAILIGTIVLATNIMSFMKRCGAELA